MPELPEVAALAGFLAEKAGGQCIDRVELASFQALKTYAPPLEALAGRTIAGCDRIGKYLLIDTEGLFLVLHLARGGWIRWVDSLPPARAKPGKGPMALRVRLEGGAGFNVTEAGTEKRLAAWVVADPSEIEHVATLGPDPLDPAFDADALARALAERPGQLKRAITDQRVVAGVGNAYSDEALHAACLSPFKSADKLSAEEVERLHSALVSVLTEAVTRSAGLPAAGLKAEKRLGMRVHGRAGEACPVCGDTVREVSFATKSLQYCPTCQTGGKPLADRRLSRLLK